METVVRQFDFLMDISEIDGIETTAVDALPTAMISTSEQQRHFYAHLGLSCPSVRVWLNSEEGILEFRFALNRKESRL